MTNEARTLAYLLLLLLAALTAFGWYLCERARLEAEFALTMPQQAVPAPTANSRSWMGLQMTTEGREGLPQVSGVEWRPCPKHTPNDVIVFECPVVFRHNGEDVIKIDPAGPSIRILRSVEIHNAIQWER